MTTQAEYVKPNPPPKARERPTIARMLTATFVFAVTLSCFTALRPLHPALAIWILVSLICGAAGLTLRGHEGFWAGLGFGGIVIPVLMILLWFVVVICYFMYMEFTGQHIGGLGS